MGTKFKYIYLWTHIGLYGVAGSRAGLVSRFIRLDDRRALSGSL